MKAVGRRQWAAGGGQWAVGSGKRSADLLRLCRRTVRKGSAFLTLGIFRFGEAAPRQNVGGGASRINSDVWSVSQRLTALCGGKAASLVVTAFCLLLTAHCALLTAQGQMIPKGNSPLYSSRPYEPRAPSGLPKALNDVGIDQKLNEQLPLELAFKDDHGNSVKLGDYFGKKPVMLSLVYYQCPMLCNQVLNGMVTAFRVMNFKPGEEFEVVTVSFDPRETPALAAAKKSTYVNYLPEAKREKANAGWHFLTGDEASIKRLTDAVGFRYHFDESTNQFAHASGVFVTTPEGKLARYFYGIEYAPRDLRLGLIEAADNKIGSRVDQLLLYCYHYDPATGKYGAAVMKVMRVAGIATLVAMVGMFLVMRRRNQAQIDLSAEI